MDKAVEKMDKRINKQIDISSVEKKMKKGVIESISGCNVYFILNNQRKSC